MLNHIEKSPTLDEGSNAVLTPPILSTAYNVILNPQQKNKRPSTTKVTHPFPC